MKNKFKIIVLLTIGFSVVISCNKNETINKSTRLNDDIVEVTTQKLFEEFTEIQNTTFKNDLKIEFDNNHIYEVKQNGKSTSVLMVNQVNFDEDNIENYGFAAVSTENGLVNPFIVRTLKINSTIYQIDYYKQNMKLCLSVQINSETQLVNVLYKTNFKDGDDVMDCIVYVYSDMGWLSVIVFIETAFIPWTAVAIAAECILIN